MHALFFNILLSLFLYTATPATTTLTLREEPTRPTFSLRKAFPGSDVIPSCNSATGDCQWFFIAAEYRDGILTRCPPLHGVSNDHPVTPEEIDIWFEAFAPDSAEGTWCISHNGHIKMIDAVKTAPSLSRVFHHLTIDPDRNNRLLPSGAPHIFGHNARCSTERAHRYLRTYLADMLGSYAPTKQHRSLPIVLLHTGSSALEIFRTHIFHTPLLYSLIASLYWTYTVQLSSIKATDPYLATRAERLLHWNASIRNCFIFLIAFQGRAITEKHSKKRCVS